MSVIRIAIWASTVDNVRGTAFAAAGTLNVSFPLFCPTKWPFSNRYE